MFEALRSPPFHFNIAEDVIGWIGFGYGIELLCCVFGLGLRIHGFELVQERVDATQRLFDQLCSYASICSFIPFFEGYTPFACSDSFSNLAPLDNPWETMVNLQQQNLTSLTSVDPTFLYFFDNYCEASPSALLILLSHSPLVRGLISWHPPEDYAEAGQATGVPTRVALVNQLIVHTTTGEANLAYLYEVVRSATT